MLVDAARDPDFEIVIGFAAPIGTDLDSVIDALQSELRVFAYDSESIRLSHLLDVDGSPDTLGYYKARMDKGDELRRRYGSGEALAAIAITKMWSDRGDQARARRFAWLLRTLKHTDEVKLLRQTYGQRFILVGVHQDLPKRMRNLSRVLRDEHPESSNLSSEASDLVRRDEQDSQDELGQHSRDTYALSDYFLDLGADLSTEVRRLVGLLFGEPFLTPTRDEVGMFAAYGVSMRSADPGRQVGAAVTKPSGEIIATGTNEVPKFGGGEYWPGDLQDSRDFQLGHDYNKKQTRRVLREVLGVLAKGGLLSETMADANADERVEAAMKVDNKAIKKTRLMSLIEFGRIVHAEMSALMQAARLGTAVGGSTLYTTAFPCHMCMRLIIASGIERVVYIDPYPKSLAFEMYGDSISEDRTAVGSVKVVPYCGASPLMFSRVFEAPERKRTEGGEFEAHKRPTARMRLAGADPLLNAQVLEAQVAEYLTQALGPDVGGKE